MAARASAWWAWRAGHSVHGKASAKKGTLALQDRFLHSVVLTTVFNFNSSEETLFNFSRGNMAACMVGRVLNSEKITWF